jgi:hypothetical protein
MTSDRRSALLAAVAVLVVLVGATLLRRRGDPPSTDAPARSAHTTPPKTSSPEARRARDAMHEQILEALRRRDAGAPPPRVPSARSAPEASRAAAAAPPANDPSDHGTYDPQYIRDNVREQIFPLLASCYKEALSRNPKLAGKLVFSFRIVGDPSVGGVIEDAEFADGSEIKDAEMETCTRESMMSLSLDKPPSGGGYVSVTYPVAFAPGDDEDDDAGGPGDAGER